MMNIMPLRAAVAENWTREVFEDDRIYTLCDCMVGDLPCVYVWEQHDCCPEVAENLIYDCSSELFENVEQLEEYFADHESEVSPYWDDIRQARFPDGTCPLDDYC